MFWLIFAIVVWGIAHSVAASLGFKNFLRRVLGSGFLRLYRLLYNFFSMVSFVPLLYFASILPNRSGYFLSRDKFT